VVKKVKKENVTPDNIGEIMLSQIPGISSVTAIAIMKKYGTISNVIKEIEQNPNALSDVVCEVAGGKLRKINKSSVESIRKYLMNPLTA
jgi:ERCC4-type nuclease